MHSLHTTNSSTPQSISKHQTKNMHSSFPIILLLLSSLLFSPPTAVSGTTAAPATIQRSTKQQIIATIPPSSSSSHLFLTSLSGNYAAYFLRRATSPGAGGFGNEFCYIQIQDTSTEHSVWESECMPVSTANACTLVFSDAGLEVFDGSQSTWSTEADGNHVDVLELVDVGDMRIIDKDGELAWKASDVPQANQGCGLPGSPGLAPDSPPFAGLIGSSGGDGAFGQPAAAVAAQPPAGNYYQQQQQQQQQEEDGGNLDGGSQAFGFGGQQPLVDSTPYDSGSLRGVQLWLDVGLALGSLLVCGFFL